MKQVFIIISLFVVTTVRSYAADPNVSATIEQAFKSTFLKAENVSWATEKDFTVASFTIAGKKQFAYYNQLAELVVVAEPLTLRQLPISLEEGLSDNFSDCTPIELYKMKNDEGIRYYAVLVSAKEKLFVSWNGGEWQIAKSTKK